MKMFRRILAAALLAGATLLPAAASAQPPIPPIPGCEAGQLPSGAFSLICVPPPSIWNGELVVFAHGYVPVNPLLPVNQQLIFANLQLPDGTPLPQFAARAGIVPGIRADACRWRFRRWARGHTPRRALAGAVPQCCRRLRADWQLPRADRHVRRFPRAVRLLLPGRD